MQWQFIPVNFDQGLSQKSDDKQITNKWLTLENVVMEKTGKFQKRRGLLKGSLLQGATSFSDSADALYGFPRANDSSLRSRGFANLGIKPTAFKFSRAVYAAAVNYAAYSIDSASGTTCEFHLRGYDSNFLVNEDYAYYNLDISAPRLSQWVATSEGVVGGFYKTGSGVGADIAVQSGNGFTDIVTNASFSNLSAFSPNTLSPPATFVVYSDITAGNTAIKRFNRSTNSVDASATIGVSNKPTAISSDGTYVYVVVDKTLYRYNFDLTSPSPLVTASAGTVVCCGPDSSFVTDDGSHCYVIDGRFRREFKQSHLKVASATPFVINTDEIYLLMTQRQPADVSKWAGGFVIKRIDNKARAALGNNGYLDYYNDYIGSILSSGRAVLECGLLYGFMSKFAGTSQSYNGVVPIITADSMLLGNFISGTDSFGDTIQRDLVYGTSSLKLYTGGISASRVVSAQSCLYGWHYAPVISAVSSGSATTTLAAGSYELVAVFEHVTSQGNIIRSVPSFPVTLAAHTANKDIVVTIQCPLAEGGKVLQSSVIVYAIAPGSPIAYACEVSSGETNQKITETVTVNVTKISATPIYTTGGILEDLPPPTFLGAVSVAKNRAWIFSSERPELRYTDEIYPGFLPAFCEAYSLPVPQGGGSGSVVKELDGKIIVFQEYQVSATYGDGPDETGQGLFPSLQIIARDIGAIVPNSAITTNDGIYFLSEKGLWLLDRTLTVQFIGAGIDDDASAIVCGAKLTDREQIWFFTTNKALIFDAYHKIWTTAPLGISGITDAKTVGGSLNVLAGGYAYSLSGTSDDTGNITVKLITGWMQLGNIQGFQRMRRITFLASQLASTTMTIKLRYDFSATVAETFTAASASLITSGDNVQWQIRPRRQKCEALQMEISYTNTTGGVSFSNFAIEAGVIPLTNRLAASNRVKGA